MPVACEYGPHHISVYGSPSFWLDICRGAGIDEVQIRAGDFARPLCWRHGQAPGCGCTCADSRATTFPSVSFLSTTNQCDAHCPASCTLAEPWGQSGMTNFDVHVQPQRLQKMVSDNHQLHLQNHFRYYCNVHAIADLCHPIGKLR
jgi:hypothetical protein